MAGLFWTSVAFFVFSVLFFVLFTCGFVKMRVVGTVCASLSSVGHQVYCTICLLKRYTIARAYFLGDEEPSLIVRAGLLATISLVLSVQGAIS